MAGGKETPRQKLINLMYLVLLAMLALQVSAAIIQKFHFLNESLELTVKEAVERNGQALVRMKSAVEQNKSAPEDLAYLKSAEEVHELTQNLLSQIESIKEELIERTGGIDENDLLVGLKEEEPVAVLMVGNGESKSGKGYSLQQELNSYVDDLNKVLSSSKIAKQYGLIALDGKEDPIFKNDPDQKAKDFVQLNFESTPLVAALAVLTEKENKILAMESEVLEMYAAKLGQFVIPVDKVRPVVMTPSNTVVAGTEYSADLFMAAYSSNFKPDMTFNGNALDVTEQGVGNISFRAAGGGYNEAGLAKKIWKGTIRYPKPGGGDSLYEVEHEYYVAKPVIEFKSAAVKTLYSNSENKMNIGVPALGANARLSFSGQNAKIIELGGSGKVRLVPDRAGAAIIKVYNDGVYLGEGEFKVVDPPVPLVTVICANKPVDPIQGISVSKIGRISTQITPNEEYKKLNPTDVYYEPYYSQCTAHLVRYGREVERVKLNRIRDLRASAKKGDIIVIDYKYLRRKNFKGEWERVKLKNEIKSIPITKS